MSEWSSIISPIIQLGFSVVVCWYLLSKAIPKMQEDQDKARDIQRLDFINALKDVKTTFENREIRAHDVAKDALETVVKHCEKESILRSEVLKIELGQVVHAINDQRNVLEEVRDALQNVNIEMKHNKTS